MTLRKPFVWFDFGGVLSPSLPELFDTYAERTGIPSVILQEAMAAVALEYSMPTLAPIELAVVDERTWVRKLHEVIAREYPGVDLTRSELDFGRQWFDGHRANESVRQFALELATSGIPVGILSNNVVEWEPYWRPMVGLDCVVTDVVDSCKVGVRKPDPSIFGLAAERNGVLPNDCILIDDIAENCAAARQSGWSAVQFVDAEQAIGDVRELLSKRNALSSHPV
ncbi:HAD-IA family hydrolase [Rhodococcus maanshanensis]|uniref:Putative hydrolase of the HAD superfamily n=1 Tax=Rhodococcus maanshanensis TaxID=183556 RepID=A0A1H7YNV6_9NOCA|nr:HAD-IA family hydrolase [Rhodococcus maanshanensis]SEM47534.1 putative hydrolase of the HAD superfamily [Rhodococcus maanshanensis]